MGTTKQLSTQCSRLSLLFLLPLSPSLNLNHSLSQVQSNSAFLVSIESCCCILHRRERRHLFSFLDLTRTRESNYLLSFTINKQSSFPSSTLIQFSIYSARVYQPSQLDRTIASLSVHTTQSLHPCQLHFFKYNTGN